MAVLVSVVFKGDPYGYIRLHNSAFVIYII